MIYGPGGRTVRRGTFVLCFFAFAATVLIFTIFRMQVTDYDVYRKAVLDQMTVGTDVNPLRGVIYDRNGKVIAGNMTVYTIFLSPSDVSDEGNGPDGATFIAQKLSKILNVSEEKIVNLAKHNTKRLETVRSNVGKEEVDEVRRLIDEYGLYEQIRISASTKRYYPYGTLASHVIGFTNVDGVGVYGLENRYNNVLEGTSGRYLKALDARSNDMPFFFETYEETGVGASIVTTIDLYIQSVLEKELKTAAIEAGAANRATGIVMDPKTGEIFAMATYPAFDLNDPYVLDELSARKLSQYEKGSREYSKTYLDLLYKMWNNKAITGLYEPGSTFKVVTTSVALETGSAKLTDRFFCSGSLKIDGYYRPIACHKRTGHGSLTFAEALQQSCNPSMMTLAMRIGRESFYDYFLKFGYGERTGIDLPGEAKGYYHDFSDFSNVSLAVYSFGQTFKTTAIQQITAVSVIANGGTKVTPHLVREIRDANGESSAVAQTEPKRLICEETAQTIATILEEGVSGTGGARNAYVAGYKIAAKTGTSEKKDKYDASGNTSYRVSSCVGFAPYDDARVAIILIVDEPTVGSVYGSQVAAPYVGRIFSQILPYLGYEPEYRDGENVAIRVPDAVGEPLENAKKRCTDLGLRYEIVGDGDTVLSQMPLSNATVNSGGFVIFYTGDETVKNTVTVPELKGKSAAEANRILIDLGLNICIEGTTNYEIGKGAVVTVQSPSAGTEVPAGEAVTLRFLYTDEED